MEPEAETFAGVDACQHKLEIKHAFNLRLHVLITEKH